MPRTKVVRKRKSGHSEIEEDFAKQAQLRIRKKESEFNTIIQNLAREIDSTITSLPAEVLGLTLNDLMSITELDDSNDVSSLSDNGPAVNIIPPSTVKAKKPLKRQTAASTDDGYVTESGAQQRKHVSRIDKLTTTTNKRSVRSRRSSSSSQIRERPRLRSSSQGNSCTRSNHNFITPAAGRNKLDYSLVTPKVKPNTPLNMLRRPREGEMALSMQGSPLLVSAIAQDRTANVNVPLHNGNVLSLLPNDGRFSHIPELDEETKRQLKTLQGHIEKVLRKH